MYASFWNFAPHGAIDIKDNVITANAGGVKSDIYIFAPKIKLTREQGLYSHHYNAIENISRVRASFKGKANAHMMSVIVGDTASHKDVHVELVQVKDEYGNVMRDADAIKIDIDGTTYTFIATFREHIQLLLAGDKPATGKYTLYIGDEYNIIKW